MRSCSECGNLLPGEGEAAEECCPKCLLLLGIRGPSSERPEEPRLESAGDRIGHFKLLEVIGEGAFGTVWMAEQERPVRRRVALKVIKLGMDTRSVVARFEAERQALAMMDHPNIARVFDGGTTRSGRPYFVMELVRGVNLTEFCDARKLKTSERIELFIKVCEAVQHAHQKGVIHRDLKPSNILVTEQDGRPLPKVIDFGIAKATESLTDKTYHTHFNQFMGTPAYMSPEQTGLGLDIDTRSDVYSLGVLLYELVTGHTPFDTRKLMTNGVEAVQKAIREIEPLKPSTRVSTLSMEDLAMVAERRQATPEALKNALSGDLDWVVVKALEKERSRRFDSAVTLAADLRCYLNNEPISARPPTAGYRLRKSWKRNKLLYIALFSITAALMIGLASSLFQQARIKRTARTLRESLYASEMNTAFSAWREGRVSQARALLDKQRPTNAESDLRSFDWRYLWQVTRPTEAFTLPGATYWGVAISPDGKITASVGQNELALWSVENQKKILTLGTNYSWNHSLAFSPDGKMLAAPNGNGGANFVVDLWDVPNQRRLHQLVFPQQVLGVTFSPDGNTLITTAGRVYERDTPGEVRLWDPHSGLVRASLKGITSWVCQAAFSPNGDVFATSSGDGVVRVWASATGAKLRDFPAQGGFVFPVTFSRDGRLVAAGTQDGYVWIWDWENGRTESFFKAHEEPIYALRFMKDNQRMVTASRDYTARLWDVNSKQELQRFAGHTRAVNDVAILPDERTIVTSSEDLNLKFWKIRPEAQGQLLTETTEMCGMRFGGSRYLFVIEWQPKSRVTIFDTESRRKLKVMKGQEAGGSASGRRLVVADGSKLILLDPVTLAEVGQVECNTELGGAMSFSPDDRWVALRRRNGFGGPHDAPTKAIIVDLTKLQVVHELDTSDEGFGTVFFASAGKLLITMKFGDKAMRLWETATWSLLPESIPPGPSSDFPNVALSPDGNVVAKGGEQGLVRRWTLSPFAELPKLQLVGGFVLSLAFSGDGKTLAIGTDRGQLTLYNVAAGREVVAFPAHAWYAGGGAAFSPDDRFVASSGYDKKVLLWKAPSWDEITRRETFVLEPTTK